MYSLVQVVQKIIFENLLVMTLEYCAGETCFIGFTLKSHFTVSTKTQKNVRCTIRRHHCLNTVVCIWFDCSKQKKTHATTGCVRYRQHSLPHSHTQRSWTLYYNNPKQRLRKFCICIKIIPCILKKPYFNRYVQLVKLSDIFFTSTYITTFLKVFFCTENSHMQMKCLT